MDRIKADLIRKLLHAKAPQRVARALDRLAPADIAELFAVLSPGETVEVFDILFDARRAAKTLAELPYDYLASVLARLDDERVARVVSRLPSDDATLFVQALGDVRREGILRKLPEEYRNQIQRLLTYPEDSAGRVMTTQFIALEAECTAHEAIERIRAREDVADSLFHLFVVDNAQRLVGTVPLRRLVAAQPSRTLADMMLKEPVSILAFADQEEAANLVSKYNLLAIPVVDDEHRIVGIITVDDVIDVIREEATEDMYLMAGLDGQDRVFSPTVTSIRRRLPWNMLNMATAFLAASVVGLFESAIATAVALATFMPVVAGMGGNAGIQTLTVVTRGIALGEIEFSSGMRAVFKEITVGLFIGLMMGVVTGLVAWAWKGSPVLGIVLVTAMVCNMTMAGLMGAAIPLGLKLLKLDPALGGGVLLTAFTDSFGFFTFLGLATIMM